MRARERPWTGDSVDAQHRRPPGRVLRQLPVIAVLALASAGFVATRMWYWRKGMLLIGIALLLAAGLRLLLPSRRAGLLVVRGRAVDVAVLGGLGAAVGVLATVTPGPPPGS